MVLDWVIYGEWTVLSVIGLVFMFHCLFLGISKFNKWYGISEESQELIEGWRQEDLKE